MSLKFQSIYSHLINFFLVVTVGKSWWSITMLCLMGILRNIGKIMWIHGSTNLHASRGNILVMTKNMLIFLYSKWCWLWILLFVQHWNCLFNSYFLPVFLTILCSPSKKGRKDLSTPHWWSPSTNCTWKTPKIQRESSCKESIFTWRA